MNNPFLDAQTLMSQNDILNYINYDNLSQEHKEMLRTDTWDWHWTEPAAAVYFPGNQLLKARTTAVNPQFPTMLGQMTAIVRQFQINQATISGTTSGTISFEYNDLEDQAITAWLDDWRDKMGDREHRYAFRKEDTIAHGRLTMMNSSRRPIRIYSVITVQPQDPGAALNPSFTSDDPQNAGMISATFTYEHFRLDWKNI